MMYHIFHDLPIAGTKDRVFHGVSDPAELVNWWPLTCSGVAEQGHVYKFHFGPGYDWEAKVIKVLPGKAFHLKMGKSDMDWEPTSFGFDIEEREKLVWLKFWHRDWPSCNDHFRRSSFCWAILLQGLKGYLEKGTVIPFEKRN